MPILKAMCVVKYMWRLPEGLSVMSMWKNMGKQLNSINSSFSDYKSKMIWSNQSKSNNVIFKIKVYNN